jgi:hypothetical protein
VAARFAQTKLHPVLGAFVSLASGKQFNGKDVSVASFVSDMTVPLSARSVWETYHIEDPAAATALATAQIMGVRVRPDYDSPAFMQYDAASESDYKKKVAKIIVAGTDPKSTESEKAYMKNIVSEMSSDEQIKILKDFWLEKHGNTRIYKANGFTSLGRRIAEIKARKEK